MKITKLGEQIGNIGKSREQKERLITISEAHALWETLTAKYDAIHLTSILLNVTKDEDLKIVLRDGIKSLRKQAAIIEKLMNTYSVPLTNKPPESINISPNINIMSDEVIYKTIHSGMESHMKLLADNFNHAISSTLREAFRSTINIEMDLYDAFTEYGKLKGYLSVEPYYKS